MKRTQEKQPEVVSARSEKRPCLYIENVPLNRFELAVEAACRRAAKTNGTLSNQPLIIRVRCDKCTTEFAYWPADKTMGLKVMARLEDAMDEFLEDEDGDEDEVLALALLEVAEAIRHDRDTRLCRTLGIKTVDEVGTLRLVLPHTKNGCINVRSLHQHLYYHPVIDV